MNPGDGLPNEHAKGIGKSPQLIRDLKGDRDSGGVMTNTEIFKAPR